MKLKLPFTLLFLILSFSSAAHADVAYTPRSKRVLDPHHDQYVFASGGINLTTDTRFKKTTENKQNWKHGGSAHIAYGHNMDSFVAELELSFFSSNLDKHIVNGVRTDGTKGDLYHYNFMANVLQHIPITDRMNFLWGLGAGAAWVNVEIKGPSTVSNQVKKDARLTLGFQGIGGFVFEIQHNLELLVLYRGFSHLNTKHRVIVDNTTNATDKHSMRAPIIQSFEIGARYLF